jgi:hypothetical protein
MARRNATQNADESSNVATLEAPATDNGSNDTADSTEGTREKISRPTDDANVVETQYKIAGSVPQSLLGAVIWTPEAKNIQGIAKLVEDGKEEHIVKLAQGALDVNRQRVIRAAANSKEVAEILSGEAEGTADLSTDERVAKAVEHIQSTSSAYTYGSITRGSGTGTNAKAKKFDAAKDRAKAAVQANPELRANLAAIFGEDFDLDA